MAEVICLRTRRRLTEQEQSWLSTARTPPLDDTDINWLHLQKFAERVAKKAAEARKTLQ